MWVLRALQRTGHYIGEASRYARYDSGTTFTATISEVIKRDLDRSDTGKVRASTPSTAEAAADKWGTQTSGGHIL
jgi:hypothetical protein